jgi:hypothetical protein
MIDPHNSEAHTKPPRKHESQILLRFGRFSTDFRRVASAPCFVRVTPARARHATGTVLMR